MKMETEVILQHHRRQRRRHLHHCGYRCGKYFMRGEESGNGVTADKGIFEASLWYMKPIFFGCRDRQEEIRLYCVHSRI